MPIAMLTDTDLASRDAAAGILLTAFDDPEHYGLERIMDQLKPASPPGYRHFFICTRGEDVVGVGGVKSADWASNTHILFLSAVAEHARGQGIARSLINARIAWVMENHTSGRLLVSTTRTRRFTRLGFRLMGKQEVGGRRLMLMEF